ncbi:MAG: hypothetical protein R3F21_22010 [Myxococcota bacterium]
MASIRRQGEVYEIRECVPTSSGPRQRALARFRRILTPADLDRAEAVAQRPFDRAALLQRARAQGIPVAEVPPPEEARRLLAHLRDGGAVDPLLAGLLVEALRPFQAPAAASSAAAVRATADEARRAELDLPEHLADVVDWVGRSESVRGRALRGLLRTASRVFRSRAVMSEPVEAPYPRFSSGRGFA